MKIRIKVRPRKIVKAIKKILSKSKGSSELMFSHYSFLPDGNLTIDNIDVNPIDDHMTSGIGM